MKLRAFLAAALSASLMLHSAGPEVFAAARDRSSGERIESWRDFAVSRGMADDAGFLRVIELSGLPLSAVADPALGDAQQDKIVESAIAEYASRLAGRVESLAQGAAADPRSRRLLHAEVADSAPVLSRWGVSLPSEIETTARAWGDKAAFDLTPVPTRGSRVRPPRQSRLKKPSSAVPLADLVAFLVAASDPQRRQAMDAIREGRPLGDLLRGAPGQRDYWRRLIDDFKTTQTRDRYQSLAELVSNALDAMDAGGEVRVDLDAASARVGDSGKGMSLRDVLVSLLIPTITGKEGQDTIGRFGVGFYSVLQLLKTPQDRVQVTTSDGRESTRVSLRWDGDLLVEFESRASRAGAGTSVLVQAAIDVPAAEATLAERFRYVPDARVLLGDRLLNDMSGFSHVEGREGVRLSFSEQKPEDSKEARSLLTLNRVVVPDDAVSVEAENVPGTLVVNLPPKAAIAISRKMVEVDGNTIRILKAAVDAAADSPHAVRLLNGLAPLIAHVQSRNASPFEDDNLSRHLIARFAERAQRSGTTYLPDVAELRAVVTPEAVWLHPLIYNGLNPPWPFEPYAGFGAPGSKFYTADFRDPLRIFARFGSVVLLNRAHLPKSPRAKGAFQRYLELEGIRGEFLFARSWKDRLDAAARFFMRLRWLLGLPLPRAEPSGGKTLEGKSFSVLRELVRIWKVAVRDLLAIPPSSARELPYSFLRLVTWAWNFLISIPLQLPVIFSLNGAHVLGSWIVTRFDPGQVNSRPLRAGAKVLRGVVLGPLWIFILVLTLVHRFGLMKAHWLVSFALSSARVLVSPARPMIRELVDKSWEEEGAPRPRLGTRLFLRSFVRSLYEDSEGRKLLEDAERLRRLRLILRRVAQEDPFRSPLAAPQLVSALFARERTAEFVPLLERFLDVSPDRFLSFLKVTIRLSRALPAILIGDDYKRRYFEVWRGLLAQDPGYIQEIVAGFEAFPKKDAVVAPYLRFIIAEPGKSPQGAQGVLSLIPAPEAPIRFKLSDLLSAYLQGRGPASEGAAIAPEDLASILGADNSLQRKVAERLISNSANFQTTEAFIYLRELLQNALDALLTSGATESDRLVEVRSMVLKDRWLVSFEDRVGMDLTRIVQALLIPNVSTKRGEPGVRGRFGHGFFTVFKSAEEVRIKSSLGDGKASYLRLIPVRRGGLVVDVRVALEVKEEYFKGSAIQVVLPTDSPGIVDELAKERFKTYGRTVSREAADLLWNGETVNKVGRRLGAVSGVSVYQFLGGENAVTTGGLFLKPLSETLLADVPSVARAILLKAGITLDTPPDMTLLRDRSDFADAAAQWRSIQQARVLAAMRATVELVLGGDADLHLLPEDLYSELARRQTSVPRSVLADGRKYVRGEAIDWTPYEDSNKFAMLLVSLPFIEVKGQDAKRTLLEVLEGVRSGAIRPHQLPASTRRYVAWQAKSEAMRRVHQRISAFLTHPLTMPGFAALGLAGLAYAFRGSFAPAAAVAVNWPWLGAGAAVLVALFLSLGLIRAALPRLGRAWGRLETRGTRATQRWRASLPDTAPPATPVRGMEAAWAFLKVSEDVSVATFRGLPPEMNRPQTPHTYYFKPDASIAHAYQNGSSMGWNLAYIGSTLVRFARMMQGCLRDEAVYRWAKAFHETHSHELSHNMELQGEWTHNAAQDEKQKAALRAQLHAQDEIDGIFSDARSVGSGLGSRSRLVRLLRKR